MENYEGKMSACCGEPIIYHDLCSGCFEHTEPMEEEEEATTEKGE
jgi:hypothetical protein